MEDLVIEILGKDHEISYFTPSESCKIFVTGTSCFQEVKYRPTVPLQLKDRKLFVFLWQAIKFALDRLPTDIWGVSLMSYFLVLLFLSFSSNFATINWLYYAYKNNCWLCAASLSFCDIFTMFLKVETLTVWEFLFTNAGSLLDSCSKSDKSAR